VGLGADTSARARSPDSRAGEAFEQRTDRWVAVELLQGLGGHDPGPFSPLGRDGRGGLGCGDELTYGVLLGIAHNVHHRTGQFVRRQSRATKLTQRLPGQAARNRDATGL